MAENNLEILIDINSDTDGAKKAQSAIQSLEASVASLVKKLTDVGAKSAVLGKKLTDVGAKSAVAFAGFAASIGVAVSESIDAEKTTAKLSQAIANQGSRFKGTIADVQSYSDALAKKLKIDDDDVDSIQTTLLAYGVQEKSLKATTAAVYDYAAATGTDALSAVDKFKRAAAGGTKSLAAFNAIALNAKGSAEALANTNAGKLQGFNVAINDLRQSIGDKLLPTLSTAADVATKFINTISNNAAFSSIVAPILLIGAALTGLVAVIGLVGGQVLGGIAVLAKLATVLNAQVIPAVFKFTAALLANPLVLAAIAGTVIGVGLIVFFDKLTKKFGDVITPIKLLTAAFIIFWGIATGGIAPLIAGLVLMGKGLYDIIKSTKSLGDAFKLLWASTQLAAIEAFNIILKGYNKLAAIFKQKPLELIDTTKLKSDIAQLKSPKPVEVAKTETQKNIIQNDTVETGDKKDKEKQKAYAEDLADYEKLNQDKLISSAAYIEKQKELNQQVKDDSFTANLTELELNQQKIDAEAAQLETWHAQKLALAGGDNEARAQIEATYLQKSIDLQKQKTEGEKKVLGERFALAKTFFANLAVVNKDAANAQKAVAIGEALINGFLAVSKAIASAPFPANIPSIAFAVSQSAAQVAGIQAQSFAVGATNIPQDQLANIHAGEMIIPKTFAEGIRAGDVSLGETSQPEPQQGGAVEVILSLRDGLVDFIEAEIVKRGRVGGTAIGRA